MNHCTSALLRLIVLATFCLPAASSGQTLSFDDFSSGNLSGGSGWSNSWSAGVVNNETLLFDGTSSQNSTRNFSGLGATFTPRPAINALGAYAGFYSVQYEVAVDITSNNTGNYGFRMFQGANPGGGTFLGHWKNDYNSGRLTFIGSNGADFATSPTVALDLMSNAFDVWDIRAEQNSASNGISYLFTYDVTVAHGQNPSQFRGGFYDAQVVRLENGAISHISLIDQIGWRDTNDFNLNSLESITFQNTNNRTNLFIDDVRVSTTSLMIPEPSSSAFAILGIFYFAFIRRRGK